MATDDSVAAAAANRNRPRSFAAMLRSQMRNIAPFLTLICLTGFFAVASPSFATLDNLGNILTQISVTGIIAVGLTFVILCAEIDLSIASIANVTGIAVAYFTAQEAYVNIANIPMPGWAAILLALALCAMLGLVNSLGLTVIGIPSFIMTLAMMQIAAGISALLVRGQIAYKVPPLVSTLGSSTIGGVPWIVIVAALMLLGGHLVLTYTRFGRYVYMVGGNREAAEYSGLNVKLILGSVMVISAVCAGIGGMLGVAHFGSAQQNEFELVPAGFDRRRRGRRHQPVRRPWRHSQYHCRPVRARCPQQRARSRQHRQLPEDPDSRPDPAGGARHQRLCATLAGPHPRIVRFSQDPAASRAARAPLSSCCRPNRTTACPASSCGQDAGFAPRRPRAAWGPRSIRNRYCARDQGCGE